MGLFGPSKLKITPNDFVKTQIDKIFSSDFIDAEKNSFANLSKEISMLQRVSHDKYLEERQNVIYNLFHIAWCQTAPHDIFIKYSLIFIDNPRVKAIDSSGAYYCTLSRAQQAGMDTFGYISKVFIAQIIPQDVSINDADYSKLYEIYGTDFASLYISFVALIKQYKFVK
jgi:hypothetical protein